MFTTQINTKAFLAIHAANNAKNWGDLAARQYAVKLGVSRLYTLARQLQAAQSAGL